MASAQADLVQRTRDSMFATNARDFDAAMSVFADDAVFDMTAAGVGCFKGLRAVRRYLEDWIGSYEEQRFKEWHGEEVGNGAVFVVALLEARMRGSAARVEERWAFTVQWVNGAIARVTASSDIGGARAAAMHAAGSSG